MERTFLDDDNIQQIIPDQHDWIHILYLSISTIFFFIQVCQRILIDHFYSINGYSYNNNQTAIKVYYSNGHNFNIQIPSLNRYPTALTPSPWSISLIWYFVYLWQSAWIIYSIVGIFRRTPSGTYFYQHLCVMNKWCFFYTAFCLILYTPQLAAAARNKYGIGISIFRYIGAFCEVMIVLIVVHVSLWENLKNYIRYRCFIDIWLTRLLYHNGLALWASLLFYESCLSIVIGFIYSELISSSLAGIIGCCLLLFGLVTLSIVENIIFYNSLAFTLSPWLTFLWLLGGVVYNSDEVKESSTVVIWFVRWIFCVTCVLTIQRICLFLWRYKNKKIPTFQSPRIYSLVIEPRPF